jgi:hypothetical protein
MEIQDWYRGDNMINKEDYTHRVPTPEVKEMHETARKKILEISEWVDGIMPDCWEKSMALTRLEEAMFWTNAGIATTQSQGGK